MLSFLMYAVHHRSNTGLGESVACGVAEMTRACMELGGTQTVYTWQTSVRICPVLPHHATPHQVYS